MRPARAPPRSSCTRQPWISAPQKQVLLPFIPARRILSVRCDRADVKTLRDISTFQHPLFQPKPSKMTSPGHRQLTVSRSRRNATLSWLTSRLHHCLHRRNRGRFNTRWRNQRHQHISSTPSPLPGPTSTVASARLPRHRRTPAAASASSRSRARPRM